MKDLIVLVIFAIVVAVIYVIRLWSYFHKGGK
nr:MAG TPA: FeoB-associated Cys-rich membrane protein [Caudoviricetes sp.]